MTVLTNSNFDLSELSQQSFEAILEHWAKARMDAPMQIINKFDEAAKQLIALGGLLQALFVAVLAFGNLQKNVSPWVALPVFIPLLALVFCAAKVICTVPPPEQLEAKGAYTLFKRLVGSEATEQELTKTIDEWCNELEKLANKKHKWLAAANYLFMSSSAITLLLVILLMQMN